MTRRTLRAPIGHEFDRFLFAPIGEDRRGQPLSVLSALAQSDVDPWQEAAHLARLPLDAGAARFGALIAALPSEPKAGASVETTARDLIALLPLTDDFRGLPAVFASEEARFRWGLGALALMTALALLTSAASRGAGQSADPPESSEVSTGISPPVFLPRAAP